MSHDHEGQGTNPGGGRDEFDHFFSDRPANSAGRDPDATAWAGPAYDGEQTQASEHATYARPAAQPERQQYDEYEQTHYQPAAYYEEPPQRKGAVWAPVAVIVASLAIVAVVIALILNNSTGRMTEGAFTPTATVTKTATQSPTQSASRSSSSQTAQSSQSSGASSSSPSYATALPGSASACPGSDSYGTGPKTSCSFAAVVAALYNAKKDDAGDASFQAKSPETHDKYSVSCHEDSYVTCTTDTGAIIYVLHQ